MNSVHKKITQNKENQQCPYRSRFKFVCRKDEQQIKKKKLSELGKEVIGGSINSITLDWPSAAVDLATGVYGTVAFIGESRGEDAGLDTLKGALHSNLVRSSIKWCCCL